MPKKNLQRMRVRWPAVAMLIAAAAMPVPAAAQFFFGPPRPAPPPQQRGNFGFPFFGGPGSNPFYAPPQQRQPVESYNPPPQKKYETPPASTVAVIGDTMADWLAYGLEEALSDTPDIGVVRYIRPTSGLVRYDPRNDQLEWSASVKDILGTDKPSAIVVMLGLSDRLPLHDKIPPKATPAPATPGAPQGQEKAPDKASDTQASSDTAKQNVAQPPIAANEPQRQGPPGSYDFHTDKWAELYSKRIDDMIAAVKSRGVPVLWVGLPAVYGTKSTSDMSYLDELFRERAERAGITYVDIWDGFVDESGRYVTQGPDFEGQTRRLRTGDGVHFTKAGAIKLAEYVVQDLHRFMNTRLAPIALPAPEDTPKSGTAGPRPAVGPVLPLSASVSANTDGNNLLGDGGRSQPADPDPLATRVLVHGDPIAAPSGRADDFSWPRRSSDTGGSDIEPDPAAAAPAAKGPPAKSDAKKTTDTKTTGNAKPAPNAAPAPAAPRPAPRASLDGAPPRPPGANGGGF
jgi:hypothetical protein